MVLGAASGHDGALAGAGVIVAHGRRVAVGLAHLAAGGEVAVGARHPGRLHAGQGATGRVGRRLEALVQVRVIHD